MTTCDTIPFLSETTLAALEIETSDVVETIEALIHGSANDTVWSAPKAVILPSDGPLYDGGAGSDGQSVSAGGQNRGFKPPKSGPWPAADQRSRNNAG